MANNTYGTVQELLDEPYGRLPAPSKIPAGALEFHTADWGAADSVRLYVQDAVCKVWWPSGRTLEAFVQADGPCGWFRFTGIDSLRPEIVAPAYAAGRSHRPRTTPTRDRSSIRSAIRRVSFT